MPEATAKYAEDGEDPSIRSWCQQLEKEGAVSFTPKQIEEIQGFKLNIPKSAQILGMTFPEIAALNTLRKAIRAVGKEEKEMKTDEVRTPTHNPLLKEAGGGRGK